MPEPTPEMLSLAQNPVRPDQPGGGAATYEPEFESIKAEIAKIDSLKDEIPAWGSILTMGTNLLGTKSKDFTVAGYMVLALLHEKGYQGLLDGLSLYEALLTNFWDTGFPEKTRIRGRVGAVTWVNERVGNAITKRHAGGGELETLKACDEVFKRLNNLVAEKFGNEAPSLGDLRRALEDRVRSTTPAAPPPSASAAAGAAGGAAIDSPDAALKVIRTAGNEVRRAAEYLLTKSPASPVPYLVTRGVAWGMIQELPQNQGGVTPFNAPDPSVQAAWDRASQAGEWGPILQDAEKRVINSPFWLDINYYVALALEHLGHLDAQQAVVCETAALARRLPGLLELKFQNGTPFASDATRAWIQAAIGSGGGGDAGAGAQDDPLVETLREVRALANRGKLAEAVRLMKDGMDRLPSPRDRFRWRLALAGVCLDAGQAAVAAVQLEALDEEMEKHGLDEWEPELSIEVLRTLYKCEKKLSQNGNRDSREAVQRLDRLYGRLCRIDIVSALTLESKR